MIASFVGIMPTRPAQRTTPAAEQLVEMLAVRRQLSAENSRDESGLGTTRCSESVMPGKLQPLRTSP